MGRCGRAISIIAALGIVLSALVLLPRAPASAADADPPPVPDPFQVEITSAGFQPSTIEVVAGQSVVFTNNSGATRKVLGDDAIFDSGDIPVGGAFTVAIPDSRIVDFDSPGTPTFTGTLQVGANGFTGPADAKLTGYLPTVPAPVEDPTDFAIEPRWGIQASLVRLLVVFSPSATVADGNRLLGAIGGRISGRIGTTQILTIDIAKPAAGSFDGLFDALAELRSDPAVTAAAMDTVGEEQSVPPVPAGATDAGFAWQPYPLTDQTKTGAFGLLQARFPQAWNVLDAIRAKKTTVDVGIVDSGYDLNHGEFAGAAGKPARIQYVPSCDYGRCSANPAEKAARSHGTAASSIIAGSTVGANPLANVVATTGATPGMEAQGFVTFVSQNNSVWGLVDEKKPGGKAPDLRAINLSLSTMSFERLPESATTRWALTFLNKTCGPGDNDDASGTLPCTPNTEDGFRKEMAARGAIAGVVAHMAADKNVVIVQSATNFSGVSGNASFCVPFGSGNCEIERIDAQWSAEFAWARLHLQSGQPNNILIVGAIGPNKSRDDYSNTGADVSAAGAGVVAATPSSPARLYQGFGGTSAAAPYVTGLVSLLAQYAPNLTAAQIVNLIRDHAIADTTDGAAPRIDAYATLTAVPGALIDVVDVNDVSADGNRRVIIPQEGSGEPRSEDLRFGPVVDGVLLDNEGDGVIDMRDFRRFRDAFLSGCEAGITASADGCPPAVGSIKLNGDPNNIKFDLNLDVCRVACSISEGIAPRSDPAGASSLSPFDEAAVGVNATGTPTTTNRTTSGMEVLQMLWGKSRAGGAAADTEGYSADDLRWLLSSGDLEVHPDSLMRLGATSMTIKGQVSTDKGMTWTATGKTRTVTLINVKDGYVPFTVPAELGVEGSLVRVVVSGTTADGKKLVTDKPRVTLHAGQDVRVDPKVISAKLQLTPTNLAKGKKGTATVRLQRDGRPVQKKSGTPSNAAPSAASADGATTAADDGSTSDYAISDAAELFGAPVEFTAEGSGAAPADPSVGTADETIDDRGEADAEIDAGEDAGDAEIGATVTVDGDEIEATVPTKVTGPARLIYTWEQRITAWNRHFEGLVDPDPGLPGLGGTYDYDEGPVAGTLPVVMKRTGTIDLDAPIPTLDETVNSADYSIEQTSPFGTGTITNSIQPLRRETKDYLLDRVHVDRDGTSATIAGLRQVSDIGYRYNCNEANPSNCSALSHLQFFDSWLSITTRRDPNVYKNGQVSGYRGGDGTSFLHAPDPDADLHLRKDSSGHWIP
ncbi:MAG TPA: S8 family serine peptidase, partial [Acidimicrobiales bacterium]|nr:S8 family serine peptidase [Acidimicrobiales bacterium]